MGIFSAIRRFVKELTLLARAVRSWRLKLTGELERFEPRRQALPPAQGNGQPAIEAKPARNGRKAVSRP